ncbi:uncharacterized protein RHOBADRAFT_42038 [Rhodotorula graminis WP1]|uniref:Uncharacterized protein n=1 Tax=Rhodotorula graminis (strain WP1) TaxID=578459 RepID=A0A194S7X2_RHOGW|nr:uncharacterized protein RHOBADRAFT_42038 [Rhodotorula graminis WP1]KPV76828.1 hypothetical protein RHOBADRAFT_42038 [Rhodotorula graminis WP1]
MAALNWAMLTPQGKPVPLPHEKWLFSSSPGTVAISLFPHPPGSPLNLEPKPTDTHYKHQHGTLYLSQKRVVYVAPPSSTSTPSARRHLVPSGATSTATTSHADQQSTIASGSASILPPPRPSTSSAPSGPATLESLSVPLRAFVDGRLVQPWFSANYYEALCLEGDGNGGLEGPHLVRFYFKEGGAPDFYSAVEEVKARLELSSATRGTPVEQLPAYEPPPPSSTSSPPAPPASLSSSSSSPAPAPPSPHTGAGAVPSPADLAAASVATAADESEQLERDERCAAQGGPPPGVGVDEAPPGYDEAQVRA